MLSRLRKRLVSLVPEGSSILEAACGTGEQSLLLAENAVRVLGFDYNPVMASCAGRRIPPSLSHKLKFLEADARNLPAIEDGEFDYATITLALHEMPENSRLPVLRELSRTARNLLIVDYSSPLPIGAAGRFTRMIEWMAGRDHYSGFRSYQKAGGLDSLIEAAGLVISEENFALRGIVRILHCRQL